MEISVLNLMGNNNINGILEPLYETLKKDMVAEVKHNILMREIRGEKWIVFNPNNGMNFPCLNCYAYKNIDDNGNGDMCLNCISDNLVNPRFVKMSYLDFWNIMHSIHDGNHPFTLDRPGLESSV